MLPLISIASLTTPPQGIVHEIFVDKGRKVDQLGGGGGMLHPLELVAAQLGCKQHECSAKLAVGHIAQIFAGQVNDSLASIKPSLDYRFNVGEVLNDWGGQRELLDHAVFLLLAMPLLLYRE
jgi:hypothetical protein